MLYGGTSIALRLGHRESVDFDFFSARSFEPDELVREIPFLAEPKTVSQSQRNTYSVALAGPQGETKLSFFGDINFGQFLPPEPCEANGIKLASLEDMLVMKLKVIHARVAVKDYLDIVAMLRAGLSLVEGLGRLEAMFPETVNAAMTLQALVYFKGGDLDALPWEAKETLIDAVRRVEKVPVFSAPRDPIGATPTR